MHAVVFCHNHAALLPALSEKRPLAMMPVGDRPLLQRLVETLVRGGVASVTLVVADGGYDVASHFGVGLRWGVPINIALERGFSGIRESLSRLAPGLPGKVLVCARLLLTDIDIAGGLAALAGLDGPALFADGAGEPTDLLLLAPGDVAALPPGARQGRELAGAPGVRLAEAAPGQCLVVDDLPAYFEANRRWVRGEAPLADPGAPPIRLGRRCRVDPSAELVPAAAIGPNANIGPGCQIGPDTVIGDSVIVDSGSQVVASVVWPGAYIGPELTVRDAIVADNLVVTREGTVLAVPDPFLLGAGAPRELQDMVSGFLQKALAGAGLVLASPLLLAAWLASLARPGLFVANRRTGQLVSTDLRGGKAPRPVRYRTLAVGNPALRHLPALWDVLRGELRLVGVEPLEAAEAEALVGTWQDLRFSRPPGLIHPWHAMGMAEAGEEEKRVMENYYARTWGLREDVKILANCWRALFSSKARRSGLD